MVTFKKPEEFKKHASLLTSAVREVFKALGKDLAGKCNWWCDQKVFIHGIEFCLQETLIIKFRKKFQTHIW